MSDPKKKKVIYGVGAFGILVLGYLYFKNKNSSSSTTSGTPASTVSGADLTSYLPDGYGGGFGYNNTNSSDSNPSTATTAQPNITDSYNTTTYNYTSIPVKPIAKSKAGSKAGGTTVKKSVNATAAKGGKSEIAATTIKPSVSVSGGTMKKSTTTSTAKPVKVGTSANNAVTQVKSAQKTPTTSKAIAPKPTTTKVTTPVKQTAGQKAISKTKI